RAWRGLALATRRNRIPKHGSTTSRWSFTARFTTRIWRSRPPSRHASRSSTEARLSTRSSRPFGRWWRRLFDNFSGNAHVTKAHDQMLAQARLTQTLLFAGPEGLGKATLARRLGARLLPHPEPIERDDLSLPENVETVATREKLAAEKRNEDPLLFSSHPDFV